MALTIHDPTVAANVAAATTQEAQRAALIAPWTGGDVTVRALNGATLRDVGTYGPWVLNSATPRGMTLGSLIARTVSSTGAPTVFTFRAGSTDIFSMTAAVSPASADLVMPAAGGGVTATARTNLSDSVLGRVTISANPALPVTGSSATAFSLSVPSSGTNGTPVTVTVTPNGPIPSGGVSVTLAASNGGVLGSTSLSFTSGSTAAQTTTLTRSTSGTSVVTMTNGSGLSNNGTPANFTSSSASAPLTLAFDAQTPEQISIRASLTRAVASGTTVLAEYKLPASSTWLSAGNLFKVTAATLPGGAPAGIVDAYAGCIFGLSRGVTYDVRLTVTEPGQPVVTVTGTRATRALPAAAGAPNKTATPATLSAELADLVPGDVLELAAGTYAPFTLAEARSGTTGSPIYIRGASREGVIVSAPTGTAVTWAASHVVLENLTLQGSGTDSGTAASSAAIIFSTGLSTPQTNATIRNITATGFDRFCKAFEPVIGRLVYNCTIVGSNTWAKTYEINPASGQPNYTWNDDGVSGPGTGNCFFDSSITGHGDVWKLGNGTTGDVYTAACFMYRVACDRTGDDLAEMDESAGNCAAYDCYVKNAGTGLSVDGIYGGPIYFFRNRVGNTTRGPIKPTSESQNVAIWSNTFLRTTGVGYPTDPHNFYAAGSGPVNTNWTVRNNAIVYRGTGDVVRWDCSMPGLDWNYNAIYPATGRNITLGSEYGTQNGLTAAKAANAPRMANDVATIENPFAATITLGADYTTEFTGSMDWTLAGGVSLRNAGVALPGITDGFSGATPDIGAVITGRASAEAGDKSNVPAWVTAQAAGTWGVIPGTALSAVDPDPGRTAAYTGSSGQPAIVTAWGSAWLDPETGEQCTFGGGHGDYFGNEFYRRLLGVASPAWARVSEPSNLGSYSAGTATAYSDGRLRSTHVYNAAVWVPGVGPVMAGLSSRSTDGGHGSSALIFFNRSDGSSVLSSADTNSGSGTGIAACFDGTRGTQGSVWMRRLGTSVIQRHDVAADTRADVGVVQAWNGQCSLAAHPSGDYLLVGNGDSDQGQSVTGGWCVFDCADGTYYFPTFTGTVSGGLEPGRCQPVWVPALGCFCAWDNTTDRTRITTFTPGANPRTGGWTIGFLSVDPGNAVTPSAAAPNGTFGRFAWWANAGVFVVFNSAGEAGYFFKV